MQRPEPEQAVREIYREEMAYVPYPVFMRCFGKLLEDPVSAKPREPSEELYDAFEAVCMAINAGIRDEMDRGEMRRKEFYERIYPVWKQKLSRAQYERCQMILDGTLRKMEAERHGQRARELKKAEDALSAAIKDAEATGRGRLPGHPAEEPEMAELETEQEPPAPRRAAAAAPAYPNLYALTESIESGALGIYYAAKDARASYAAYMVKDTKVSVRLVHEEASYYLIITCATGFRPDESLSLRLKTCMEKRGFAAKGDYSYSRQLHGHTHMVSLAKGVVSVARKSAEPLDPPSLARHVGVLHKLLETILAEALTHGQ